MARPPDDHWIRLAQSWQLRASPLRPAQEDIRILEHEFRKWHENTRPARVRALLLGVTPEIATMPWPAGTRFLAVDKSRDMIRAVWPGAALGFQAVCARWPVLPVADATQDLVLGDGSVSVLRGDQYGTMARAMRRVLSATGLVLMRFFTRPAHPEPVEKVFEDLFGARIGNFHVFKWRLSMAMHGSLDEGVRLADIWDTWHAAVPQPETLAKLLLWPLPEILTMDDFRGAQAAYTFPTLAEARAMMAPDFEEVGCHVPGYELGERCPTLAFRPRNVS
jgi:hypothetical protein